MSNASKLIDDIVTRTGLLKRASDLVASVRQLEKQSNIAQNSTNAFKKTAAGPGFDSASAGTSMREGIRNAQEHERANPPPATGFTPPPGPGSMTPAASAPAPAPVPAAKAAPRPAPAPAALTPDQEWAKRTAEAAGNVYNSKSKGTAAVDPRTGQHYSFNNPQK